MLSSWITQKNDFLPFEFMDFQEKGNFFLLPISIKNTHTTRTQYKAARAGRLLGEECYSIGQVHK